VAHPSVREPFCNVKQDCITCLDTRRGMTMLDTTGANSGTWIPAALTAFGGFATAALSFLGVRILDARKDERTFQREKAAREEGRRDRVIERRNEQERQTLIEVQAVAQRYLRNAGKMEHFEVMQSRETGKWQQTQYPPLLSDQAHEIGIQLLALTVRVRDEQVRNLVDQLTDSALGASSTKSEAQSREKMSAASDCFDKLNKRINEVLRALDDVELSS